MKIGILSFFSLIAVGFGTFANASTHNVASDFQSADNSEYYNYADPSYERIAQVNSNNFVVTRQDVEQVQQALIKLGYYDGNIDGLAHRDTVTAIVDLQKKEGLTITGEIDLQLLSFLGIR